MGEEELSTSAIRVFTDMFRPEMSTCDVSYRKAAWVSTLDGLHPPATGMIYMQSGTRKGPTASVSPPVVGKPFVSKINPKPNDHDEAAMARYRAIERLAAIDHDQWVFWSQQLMRDLDELITTISDLDKRLMVVDKNYYGSQENRNSRKMFDKHNARNDRWQKEWAAYTHLPEEVKEHDRIWAKKAWEAMNK